MAKQILFWVLAFLITAGSAVYQRMTGPTYPKSGSVTLAGNTIKYKLERSHSSSSNYVVEIETNDSEIVGELFWRPFQSNGEFNSVKMAGEKVLKAELPARQRLQKWQYYIRLQKAQEEIIVPGDNGLIIRFKDDVPISILIPHVIFMFGAMLLSTRAAFEIFNKTSNLYKLTLWTLVFLFIGGFPLGFAMNGYAFGEMWGGFPYGNDITDNKTLIAFIGWLVAFYMIKKNHLPKLFAVLAAILMLIVYMIPHSV